MAKKYVEDVMKVADIDGSKIMSDTFIFLTSTCESTYTDESELGEDLISIDATIKETLELVILSEECRKEINLIVKQAKARDCGYIRVIE